MADEKDAVDDATDDDAADDTQNQDDATDDDAADDAQNLDDATDDDAADDAQNQDDAGQSSQSRRESRTQRLANEARREREARIRLEAENAALKSQSKTVAPSGDAERVRNEKLALMDPAEKAAFLANEKADRLEGQLQRSNLQTQDMLDKIAFDAKASINSVYAKHQAAIENWRAAEYQAGRVPPNREICLKLMLGDAALKPSAKGKKQAAAEKAAAADRVAKSKGNAQSARGDEGGSSKKSGGDESLDDLKARILAREARGDTR